VVVREGIEIARSQSALIHTPDPSAHPELVAIREAAEKLDSRYLNDCVLYSTLEPCPMCTSAAIWAKMSRIVFGASQGEALEWALAHPDPVYTWRQILIPAEVVAAAGNPHVEVHGGVMSAECKALFELKSKV